MKTSVATSSLHAWDAGQATFACQEAKILESMTPGRIYTRKQLARMLNMETSTMSARMNSLIKAGAVEVCGKVRCPVSKMEVEAVMRPVEQRDLLSPIYVKNIRPHNLTLPSSEQGRLEAGQLEAV